MLNIVVAQNKDQYLCIACTTRQEKMLRRTVEKERDIFTLSSLSEIRKFLLSKKAYSNMTMSILPIIETTWLGGPHFVLLKPSRK